MAAKPEEFVVIQFARQCGLADPNVLARSDHDQPEGRVEYLVSGKLSVAFEKSNDPKEDQIVREFLATDLELRIVVHNEQVVDHSWVNVQLS